MNHNALVESRMYAATMTKVADSLLVKGHTDDSPETALIFTTRIDINNFQGNEDLDPVGGYLHVACFAPMNYVHVLAAFTERPVSRINLAELSWQPIACHDSCWREDGVKSVIVDAVRILNRSAVEAFKITEDKLSFHIGLSDLLIGVKDPQTVLASGLSQDERHGKLTIPSHGIWQ